MPSALAPNSIHYSRTLSVFLPNSVPNSRKSPNILFISLKKIFTAIPSSNPEVDGGDNEVLPSSNPEADYVDINRPISSGKCEHQ